MKHLIAAVLIVVAFTVATQAQTQAQAQKPPQIPQPTAEQKAKLSELVKVWDQKVREADTARDKYLIQLMATLAELGLKPSETTVNWNAKGEPVFGRAEAAKVIPKEK